MDAFCYSNWDAPDRKPTVHVTPGRFVFNLSGNVPLIRAAVTISGRAYETDRALIDTGASHSTIFSSFVGSIDMPPEMTVNVSTTSGYDQNKELYRVGLSLPAGMTAENMPVIYTEAESPYVDMIIGLDVLSAGVFIYDGVNGRFLFEVK